LAPSEKFEFWNYRPISYFDTAAEPIKNRVVLFGRKLLNLTVLQWESEPIIWQKILTRI